jgi:hypothetical protein
VSPQSEFNVGFDDGLVLSFASGRNRLYIKHHGPEGETGDLYPPLPPWTYGHGQEAKGGVLNEAIVPRLRAVLD